MKPGKGERARDNDGGERRRTRFARTVRAVNAWYAMRCDGSSRAGHMMMGSRLPRDSHFEPWSQNDVRVSHGKSYSVLGVTRRTEDVRYLAWLQPGLL